MKLPGGPMIVNSCTSCSTANAAAITASQYGNLPSRAARMTGPASIRPATVNNGPHIAAMSLSTRAVAGSMLEACRAIPDVSANWMPT